MDRVGGLRSCEICCCVGQLPPRCWRVAPLRVPSPHMPCRRCESIWQPRLRSRMADYRPSGNKVSAPASGPGRCDDAATVDRPGDRQGDHGSPQQPVGQKIFDWCGFAGEDRAGLPVWRRHSPGCGILSAFRVCSRSTPTEQRCGSWASRRMAAPASCDAVRMARSSTGCLVRDGRRPDGARICAGGQRNRAHISAERRRVSASIAIDLDILKTIHRRAGPMPTSATYLTDGHGNVRIYGHRGSSRR